MYGVGGIGIWVGVEDRRILGYKGMYGVGGIGIWVGVNQWNRYMGRGGGEENQLGI